MRNLQDIWVKACLYEYDYVTIAADVESGGSVSDRVALEYFRDREEYGWSHKTPSTMHAPMRLAMTTSYLKTDTPWALEGLQALRTALSTTRIGLRLELLGSRLHLFTELPKKVFPWKGKPLVSVRLFCAAAVFDAASACPVQPSYFCSSALVRASVK